MTASTGKARSVVLMAAGLLLPAVPGAAQTSEKAPPTARDYTVAAGVGNALGWLGVRAEAYLSGDRLSAFAGLGYTPGDRLDNTGATAALGVRGYMGGDHHRALLELSVSQLAQESILERNATGNLVQRGQRRYGPGLAVGYQYVADSGFTAMLSGGVGVAIGLDDRLAASPVSPMANLALGYTFR